MKQEMFRITVERMRTGDKFTFCGQGDCVKAALNDGIENCASPFRSRNDGQMPVLRNIGVERKDGRIELMPLKKFEAEIQQPDAAQPSRMEDAVEL